MKSISDLTNRELDDFINKGHLGILTKDISELRFFYNRLIEEKKRRNLKLKELQKILPIEKYFRVYSDVGSYLFKVIECKEAPKNMHVTHICHIEGIKILNDNLTYINNSDIENWQISDELEFGWNSKSQEMIFWIKGSFAPHEVFEIDEQTFNKYIKTLELLGFDL